MALTQPKAEQLITLIADVLPSGMEAYSAEGWALPTLVRSRLAASDVAAFDTLVAAADSASVPAIVAGALVVAGIT